MNADRLHETVKLLLDLDAELQIQQHLQTVRDALATLTNQPSDAATQSAFANSLARLSDALLELKRRLTPAQTTLVTEISGTEFFDASIVERITTAVAQNAISPAVVRDIVATFLSQRQQYLAHLRTVDEALTKLGIQPRRMKPGEAELAFLIPRRLFENHLEELSKELHIINNIIRPFSEVSIGHTEPVEVHEISTSEPVFTFGLALATIVTIGKTVNWILDALKKVLEIKKLREETKKAGFPEEQLKMFDDRITSTITEAIEKHTRELIDRFNGDVARKNELNIGVQWAMESLVARIERGVEVEVWLIEPPATAKAEEVEVFANLKTISQNLQFTEVQGPPILHLPPPEPPISGTP